MELDDEQVIRRFGPSLYRLAYSYCAQREDAEDVVQEVLIKYLRHRGCATGSSRLRPISAVTCFALPGKRKPSPWRTGRS